MRKTYIINNNKKGGLVRSTMRQNPAKTRKYIFFAFFFQKNLVISKKSSTFAADFLKTNV